MQTLANRDPLSPFDNITGRFGNNPVNEFLARPGESLIDAAHRMHIFDTGLLKQNNKTFDSSKPTSPQPVKVLADPEVASPEVMSIIKAFHNRGYQVARNDAKNYNLNIAGIRSNTMSNRFDDQIWVFWKFHNKWELKKYTATTDPGSSWLLNPMSKEGTAILKEGQYIGSHRLGKHKGVYEALVQAQPVTVIRDFNRDNKLDYSSGRTQTGIFGINIHRANQAHASVNVDKWSAGCQVFADPLEFGDFIRLCKLSLAEWGNSFSYTLLAKSDLLS